MTILPLTVGPLDTNCYLVSSGNHCVIIDPGEDADFVTSTIIEHKLTPLAILLTHAHWDHCLGTLDLKLNFNPPIYLHQADLFLYRTAHKGAVKRTGKELPPLPQPDYYLKDNQTLHFSDLAFKVIHTPGHTPGSVCFLIENHLFSGDTLFASGVGRADFYYSDQKKLQSSLIQISRLSSSTLIYPGHEEIGFPLGDSFPSPV